MTHLVLPFLVIVALVVVIAVMGAAMKRQSEKGPDEVDDLPAADFTGYERKRFLLTPAEYSFYKVLLLAVGSEHSIQVKIRLGDLIEVRKGADDRRSKLNKILQKHLDFVLCEPKSMVPMLAIELDDSSHGSAKTQQRDVFVNGLLAAVGMPIMRVAAARGYGPPELKALVEKTLPKSVRT